jgi:regulator of RNase E activity RraA
MYSVLQRKSLVSTSLIEQYSKITPSSLGHLIDEGAMHRRIKPLQSNTFLVGSAVTVKTVGRDSLVCHKVIDLVHPGDVIIIDRDGDQRYACWGEMTALAAELAGVAGVIVDGPVTDVQVLRQGKLPIFCSGQAALTTQFLGLGGSINTPIVCGGVVVNPGDLIFGDDNGVFVIPPEQAEHLLSITLEEEKGDREWREGLLMGKRPSQMAPIDELMNKSH